MQLNHAALKRAAGGSGRGRPRVPGAARGRQLMEKHGDGQRGGEIAKCCLLIYVGAWRSFPPRSWEPGKWIEKWKLAHAPTSVVGGVGVTKPKPIGRNRSDLGKLSSSQQTMQRPHARAHTQQPNGCSLLPLSLSLAATMSHLQS